MHPTFHVGLLQAHEPNNDTMFPRRDTQAFYDVSNNDEAEWVVNELLAHRWMDDTTWEPHAHCKELEALDRYLELHGAASVKQLPPSGNHGGNDMPR